MSFLTAGIKEGKEVTFKEFMSRCAMDIDFNKRSRETTFTGEIPIYTPNTEYLEKQLENAKRNLQKIRSQTDEELDAYLLDQFEAAKEMYAKRVAETEALKAPYQAMLEQAKAWTPPTPKHEFLKGYAVGSLERAMDSDCTVYLPKPELQDTAEYRQMCIEMYERDIISISERIQKEIDSCNRSNAWNQTLIDSINDMSKQTEV